MNIYTETTQRILRKLEEGIVPWRKTWTTGLPKSMTSGREYRGVNLLVLGSSGFTSRYWVTYREALRFCGHVRVGEKATPVVYWHWRTPEDMARLHEKTGKKDFAPCVPFTSAVFNLDQVEGIERPEDDVKPAAHRRLELADNVYAMMPDKPVIVHSALCEPCYSLREDRVTLPHLSQFESADEYFATLFHEIVHSCAHTRRLNRVSEREGNAIERYSMEELVAEFGAAFLCAFAGIDNAGTEDLAASYIHGWAEAFRHDERLLLRAASAAQKAADYIRGKLLIVGAPAAESETAKNFAA